jgi:hypothetical protein
VDSFYVECETKQLKEIRVFEFLSRLMSGLPVTPTDSEIAGLVEMATLLGNTELLDEFIKDEGSINQSTVCVRLKMKSALGRSVDQEVQFAASHFYELDSDDLKAIDISVLERILTSKWLRLQDEDSLLTFLCSLDSENIPALLRYLRAECLSADGMALLLDRLSLPIYDRFIWDSLCRRLRLRRRPGDCSTAAARIAGQSTSKQAKSVTSPTGDLEFPFSGDKSLDGIISYLTKKHGGNVHEKGIVTITSKSQDYGYNFPLKTIADLGSRFYFCSGFGAHPWVCWDFREVRVRLSQYTVVCCTLKSWVVEGSLDGESWTEIDRRTDTKVFQRKPFKPDTGSFAVANIMQCRLIRLTSTVQDPFDFMSLHAVEFFGTLSD